MAQFLIKYEEVFRNTTFTDIQLPLILSKPNRRSSERGIHLFASLQKKFTYRKKMVKAGLIQESTSDWALAPAFIRKQDGSVRWCIGYRILKEVTIKDIVLIDDYLDTLSGGIWFSKLDTNSAYLAHADERERRP